MRIETERLIIRDFDFKDEEKLFEIMWQKGVVRFMRDWSENNPNRKCTQEYIAWRRTQKDSKDVYENKRYAIALKVSDQIVGMVGMGIEDTLNEVEMAYFVDEAHQGKGYAFEAAHAFFDYLFGKKGARRIYAYVEDYNLSSQHLCEKLGMRREGLFMEFVSFVNNPDGTPHYENTYQYAILKKEWH